MLPQIILHDEILRWEIPAWSRYLNYEAASLFLAMASILFAAVPAAIGLLVGVSFLIAMSKEALQHFPEPIARSRAYAGSEIERVIMKSIEQPYFSGRGVWQHLPIYMFSLIVFGIALLRCLWFIFPG